MDGWMDVWTNVSMAYVCISPPWSGLLQYLPQYLTFCRPLNAIQVPGAESLRGAHNSRLNGDHLYLRRHPENIVQKCWREVRLQ
eukprot:scaffold611055_cov18-Prasinocladus_malaysianus.AAC.1